MKLKLILISLLFLVACPACISDNIDKNNKLENLSNQSAGVWNSDHLSRPNKIEIITVIFLAITAIATLSGAILKFKQRIENRPIIDVQCANYLESGKNGILRLYISASNNGQSAVTLSSIGIEIPEFKKHSLPDKYIFLDKSEYDLPFNLKQGARPLAYGYGKYINVTGISETLKSKGISEEVEAFFFLKDGLGRKYKCERPFIFPVTIEDFEKI